MGVRNATGCGSSLYLAFIRQDCIIVLYVDDAIILARDDSTLEKVQQELRDNGDNSFQNDYGKRRTR